ncbi:hypothetical protein Q669_26505 [Labrenzia sp. C1B10]|nr:hypothetical protein Q669_26505 [Labrenzia sp. C1B10]ERS04424.1 hypothetical protein Q675_29845 [Labrenzia sp. C1B70]
MSILLTRAQELLFTELLIILFASNIQVLGMSFYQTMTLMTLAL